MIAQAYCFGTAGTVPQRQFAAMALATGLLLTSPVASARAADPIAPAARRLVEADWLRQADPPTRPPGPGTHVPTWADAAGAVDGVRNGRYAFHTNAEKQPFWQVDLGKPQPVARIVVYNRLDYAPGLHNADNLIILRSDDGRTWTPCHDTGGRHFGGVRGAKPLDVRFPPGRLGARFLRLQVRSPRPVFFHLDEVEVYGPADPNRNLALRRPADQSSVSQWSTAKVPLRGDPRPVRYPTRRVIARGRLLAAHLRRAGLDTGPHERELDAAAARLAALAPDAAPAEARRLYLAARWAVRRLAFANPLLDFDKLLFVKRFTQETYPDVCLNHMPWVSRPGGDLCVLSPVSPDGRVRALLNGALGPGHVHGMDLWWGATRVVFGYARKKAPQPPAGWRDRRTNYDLRRTVEPTHLFEIGIDGRHLRQLTRGEWSDLDPTYLPNGDVAFVSERCGYSLQCNEYDKDETSCNLYVLRGDGSGIRRLSATKDGDYLPHTLDDGTIGYTRWEYQERGWAHIQSLWTIRPDGTRADALFKQHLNEPWALEDARSIPGSRKLVAVATGHHTLPAGPVVIIDPQVGMNTPAGIRIVTPGVRPPEGGMSGKPVPAGGVPDRGGFYMTPWPLSESFFLVSYTYGKQTDPTGYALYLLDVFGTKELIYRDAGISCFAPIPLRPRRRPPVLSDATDPNDDHAVCVVRQAAHGADGLDPRRVRYVRVSSRLPWPYDNTHGGRRYETDAKARGVNWTPARVIGTVPVEPDGSACFRVPPDTAVYFQLLDGDHMELRRMRSFVSFQRGEVRGCVGCHETRAKAPPAGGGQGPPVRAPRRPVPPPWGTGAMSFLRDVQPVLDRHCARCHSGLKPAAGLDLSGGLTPQHNRAYDTLVATRRPRLVSCANKNDSAAVTPPLAFGSHKSRLVHVLRGERHGKRVRLGREDWLRLVTWIDLNAPYHDRFLNKRPAAPPYDMPNDRALAGKIAAIHGKRCSSCHKPADVSRLDWLDIHRPRRSLFLAAPLAGAAGGTGKCGSAVYRDRADPDYQAALQVVQAAVERVWARPRRDVRALRREHAQRASTPEAPEGSD